MPLGAFLSCGTEDCSTGISDSDRSGAANGGGRRLFSARGNSDQAKLCSNLGGLRFRLILRCTSIVLRASASAAGRYGYCWPQTPLPEFTIAACASAVTICNSSSPLGCCSPGAL